MNALVYELAIVAAQEKAKLDQCEALLASTTAMQVRTKAIFLFKQDSLLVLTIRNLNCSWINFLFCSFYRTSV